MQKFRQKNPTIHVRLILATLDPEFPLRASLYMIVLPRMTWNSPCVDFLKNFFTFW